VYFQYETQASHPAPPSPPVRPGITLLIKAINFSFVSEIDGKFYNAILAAGEYSEAAATRFAQDKQAGALRTLIRCALVINKSTAHTLCTLCA
jgi:hypothetical protein